MKGTIDNLMTENRVFNPSKETVENSNIWKFMEKHGIKTYDELLDKANDSEWFWSEMVKEVGIRFYSEPKGVLEWNKSHATWFPGARYNIVHDALDKHVKMHPDKVAYIWISEPDEVKKYTYQELYNEVNKLANALKSMGVKKGDRVTIWMPMIVELPIAMLATAKIGAIHSVVFSGFSERALLDRINDAEAKVLITVDGFYRNGKKIPVKPKADSVLNEAPTIEKVIVFNRLGLEVKMKDRRDIWWNDAVNGQPAECETEQMDAKDTLFILYTSGTTGKPKGVMHDHVGYAVGTAATLKYVLDAKEDNVFWCTADIGWITGHSYIVYAPLILGVTSVMYEGGPLYPSADRWWKIIEEHKVSIFYTAPTAIRMFMRLNAHPAKEHDLNSLRMLGSVGEPINPEAWIWYYKEVGNERCPIMDTWWQTETGMHMITPLPITPLKPGSATRAFPGVSVDVYDDDGNSLCRQNKGGKLVITKPWPAMLQGLWRNEGRYIEAYWSKYENVYFAGDASRCDEDGYLWIQGRLDDVLKVSGHRIGNAEVESALVSHEAVSESVVVGVPDKIKGEEIVAFVILKEGFQPHDELKKDLIEHVAKEIGKLARPKEIHFVSDLPKTRSGKIMRRVCRAILLGEPTGDTSTLANPEAIEIVRKAIQ